MVADLFGTMVLVIGVTVRLRRWWLLDLDDPTEATIRVVKAIRLGPLSTKNLICSPVAMAFTKIGMVSCLGTLAAVTRSTTLPQ